MFVVVYRWKVKPGGEDQFREGWREMTQSIYETFGSRGSRLHRAEDGTWVAYAQWPDRATRERALAAPTANEAAGRKMQANAEFLAEECLEVADDLLR